MPTIPSGFANIVIPGLHFATARSAVITFGVDNNTGLTAPAVVAEAVWDAFAADFLGVLDADVNWGPIQASVNGGSGVITGSGSSSAAGGGAINSVPVNTALLVQKHSITPGRAGRGRYYVPYALNEADVSEIGTISGGTVTDHQDVQDLFLASLTAENVPMVILHSGAGTPAAVTQLVVSNLCATQRRRMRS